MGLGHNGQPMGSCFSGAQYWTTSHSKSHGCVESLAAGREEPRETVKMDIPGAPWNSIAFTT